MKAEMGVTVYKPRNTKGLQQTTSSQERGLEHFPVTASEGTKPADTLILDFQPPELSKSNILWFKPPSW